MIEFWSRSARMAAMLAATAVLSAGALAAEPEDDAERITARSFEVRYRPLSDAVDLVSTVLSNDGSVSLQPRLRRLVVQDRPEVLARVGDLLDSFDLPPRTVEVTVSLFMGSDRRGEEAGRQTMPPEISRELRGVRETLGDFTRWTAFDPLGGRSITCVEGASVTTNLSDDYRVTFEIDAVEDGVDDRVSFRSFDLMRVIRTAEGTERTELLYRTRIVVPAGRDLLVGVASGPEARRALFLKLLAKPR